MKIKCPIFATVSGQKNSPGEAQAEGVSEDAAAHEKTKNDSRSGVIERLDPALAADPFYARLILRAATIDELLSGDFAPLDGPYGDTDLAARRLSAWRRASTGGDQALFEHRLTRDGRSLADVTARFGGVRRTAPPPAALPA